MGKDAKRYRILLAFLLILAMPAPLGAAHQQFITAHEHYQAVKNGWPEANGVLYIALHHIYVQLFRPASPLALRFPDLLAGAASLILTYLLGCRCGGRRLGLLSAFFLAGNALFTALASTQRFYALNQAFCVITALLWLRSLRRSADWGPWLLYCVSMIGCMLTMFLSSALAVPQMLIYVCYAPNKGRAFWRYAGLAAVMCGILLFLTSYDNTSFIHVTYEKNLYETFLKIVTAIGCCGFCKQYMLRVFSNSVSPVMWEHYSRCLCSMAGITVLTAVSALGRSIRDKRSGRPSYPWLFGLSAVIAIASLFAFSYAVRRNMLTVANITWSLPFISVFLAYGSAGRKWYQRGLLLAYAAVHIALAPLLANTTYLCGPGAFPLRLFTEMYLQPRRDIVLVCNGDEIPGLDDYGQHLSLTPNGRGDALTETQRLRFLETLERTAGPLRLGYPDLRRAMLIMRHSPELWGRRVWLLYKANPDKRENDVPDVINDLILRSDTRSRTHFHVNMKEGYIDLIWL